MTNSFAKFSFVAICILTACTSPAFSAASFRVVTYLSNQYQSPGPLTEGLPGVFYSAAQTVFSVTTQGKLTTLATFQDPSYIQESDTVAAANGLLYSSVEQVINGGSGNLFSVGSKPGTEHMYPTTQGLAMTPVVGGLPDGGLFGVAYTFSNASYSLATADLKGNITPFYQFPGTDNTAFPVYHGDGNYYGTAASGATGIWATYFYRVTPSGAFTQIASLPFVTTALPGSGRLVQATDGNFYGIQPQGLGCSPSNQHGAIFKLTPSGNFSILHDFGPCGSVNSLIEGSDGKLYGSTQNYNALFSLTTSGAYKVEYVMTQPIYEGQCTCFLLQGSDGIIYGAATGGGPNGAGVIFALDAGLPVPKPQAGAFHPNSGAVGTRVRIWGYNLFGASVAFNGVSAAKAVNSGPNYVWVNVPAGATTGPLTVTTPGGTVTTRKSFTVN